MPLAAAGDADRFDAAFPQMYDELRRLARRRMRGERRDHTLSPTALVHEAWLKLARLEGLEWRGRAQFFALAAQAMRQVLVDHALRRKARKRGGGHLHLTVDEAIGAELAAMPEVQAASGMLQGLAQAEGEPFFIVFGFSADSFNLDLFRDKEGVGLYAHAPRGLRGTPALLGSAAGKPSTSCRSRAIPGSERTGSSRTSAASSCRRR